MIGKRTFIAEQVGAEVDRTPPESGEMAVYVAIDGASAGALVSRDEVRSNARATLDSLRAQGISQIAMLTGDDLPTALHVASALGITDV